MIIMRVIIREDRDGRATALLIQHLESQQVPHTPVRLHFTKTWLAGMCCHGSVLGFPLEADLLI